MLRLSEGNLGRFMAGDFPEPFEAKVSRAAEDLGLLNPTEGVRALRGIVAVEAGVRPEAVAKFLDWRDFETFCACLMGARGFEVERDLRLTKPRAQVDILARSPSVSLLVDCKHWGRERGSGALRQVVERQRARALLVRSRFRHLEPLAVVVLSLAEEQARFVDGGAVVPIRTLGDFLDNLATYVQGLTLF